MSFTPQLKLKLKFAQYFSRYLSRNDLIIWEPASYLCWREEIRNLTVNWCFCYTLWHSFRFLLLRMLGSVRPIRTWIYAVCSWYLSFVTKHYIYIYELIGYKWNITIECFIFWILKFNFLYKLGQVVYKIVEGIIQIIICL